MSKLTIRNSQRFHRFQTPSFAYANESSSIEPKSMKITVPEEFTGYQDKKALCR
jgi:hypothetical protein